MAYAKILLENTKQSNQVNIPIGFSWSIIVIPIFVNILIYIVFLFLTLALNYNFSEFVNLSFAKKAIFYILFITAFCLQLYSYGITPYLRNDKKWTIIMIVFGIITFGISSIVFAFLYNYIYISEKYNNGYKLSKILSLEKCLNNDIYTNTNPVEFNKNYNQYFVWISWHGIKFMRYFNNNDMANNFVRKHPKKCLEIKYFVKAQEDLASLDSNISSAFTLPFDEWNKLNN